MQDNPSRSTDTWTYIILVIFGGIIVIAAAPLWIPALFTWLALHTLLPAHRIRWPHQAIASLITVLAGISLWHVDPLHEIATIHQLKNWLGHLRHGQIATFPWHLVTWGILFGMAWWAAIWPIIQYFRKPAFHDPTFYPDPTRPPAVPSTHSLAQVQKKAMKTLAREKKSSS